ncbi:MAG: type II toxin-antitoxin system prevent-host-death family antitoxin [Actinobacteria bacterium]|nr:type II toxin-antitoxin system prevent-host-death family antitoxin [Actinomycetota bacterium]
METISHREMRNQSADILRRVEAGETIQITNRGRIAAVIAPPTGTVLDGLIERGQARPALASTAVLATLPRVQSAVSTTEIIADLRGRW